MVCSPYLIVVALAKALTLLATYTVTHFLLLTITLILANPALVLSAIPLVLTFIRATTLVPSILPVISLGER